METIAKYSVDTLMNKTDKAELFRCDTHFQEIFQWWYFRVDLCDVVLIVGRSGKRISAHRWILMACSDYFSNLLSEPIGEGQQREVTLSDFDEVATEKLINFCYSGSLEIEGNTIEALLFTANHLQLKKVIEACCEFFQRHIEPSNGLQAFFLAEQLNIGALRHKIFTFICDHFEEVSNEPEFLLLTAKQLSEFIAADKLRVPSEKFVFEVLMKWIDFKPEIRKTHFTELIAKIRLHLLPVDFLADKIEPLCVTAESKHLFLSALKSHLLLTCDETSQSRNYQSKNLVKHLLAVYTKTTFKAHETLVIAGYNLRTKAWTLCNTAIKCSENFSVALMNDDLIAVDGCSNHSYLNKVTRLNLRTMISTEMASLGTPRREHGVAVLNGSIYVIGGFDGKHLNSVERLDVTSRIWNFVASMNKGRAYPGVAILNDLLYVSGGYEYCCYTKNNISSMECYDSVKNIWISKASMKIARYSHCLAVFKGYLFAIGGLNTDNTATTVERYDPHTDKWTTIPCSINISGFTRCASIGSETYIYNNSKIYIISDESTCDKLELRSIVSDSMNILESYSISAEFVAIPFEFSPPCRSSISQKF